MTAEHHDYLRHIRPRIATTTYQRKRWQIGCFLKYLSGQEMHIANVKRDDVEAYLMSISGSQQFKQSMCCTVREFYDVLKLRYPDVCPVENPAGSIEFKIDKSTRMFKVPSQSTVDEIFARLSDADDELRLRDRLMAELAYGSGLRRVELHRLNIEDVDLENNTVRVLGKGDKPRLVPLTSSAVTTYRRYITKRCAHRGPLLVTQYGRRFTVQGVYYTMRDRVGIRPHLLRHACATHMLRNGCGIRVIQELLGHEQLSTTYVYTMVEKSSLSRVVKSCHPRSRQML